MTRTSSLDIQQLTPDRAAHAPIYRQLYHRFREAIASGQLRPGDRVASVRSLASELHLARATVELTYQMLIAEGYFLTRGPAGTFVSPGLGRLTQPVHSGLAPLPLSTSKHQTPRVPTPLPFQIGLPGLDLFPRKTWTRLTGRCQRQLDTLALHYPEPEGYAPLRHAIATYLGISRGIRCSPQQVFITAGYRGALALICRTLLQYGAVGWFEEPGYAYARKFLHAIGMRLEPISVDEQGLNVTQAQQIAPDARFAVVTPTHHSPLGVALSLSRRLALLAWAQQQQAWIIEDDYDSEFRYQGRPLPALKSLDQHQRVLYCGTFSKVLFPGLRLGYLVVPSAHIRQFRDSADLMPGPGAILSQAIVADFMDQGHFARHLRNMRVHYAARRGYLLEALDQVFGQSLALPQQAGGTHLLALLQEGQCDSVLADAAQASGLAVQPLSQWRMQPTEQGGLLLGFTNVRDHAQALALSRRLWDAMRHVRQ